MLSKQEHINFWIAQAKDDWDAVEKLMTAGKYIQALFWAHLVAEKYAKAIWIKHQEENVPPKTHNIAYLISKTSVSVPEKMTEIMLLANRFNIEGRYQEYIQDIKAVSTKSFAEENLSQIKILIAWLQQNLP